MKTEQELKQLNPRELLDSFYDEQKNFFAEIGRQCYLYLLSAKNLGHNTVYGHNWYLNKDNCIAAAFFRYLRGSDEESRSELVKEWYGNEQILDNIRLMITDGVFYNFDKTEDK